MLSQRHLHLGHLYSLPEPVYLPWVLHFGQGLLAHNGLNPPDTLSSSSSSMGQPLSLFLSSSILFPFLYQITNQSVEDFSGIDIPAASAFGAFSYAFVSGSPMVMTTSRADNCVPRCPSHPTGHVIQLIVFNGPAAFFLFSFLHITSVLSYVVIRMSLVAVLLHRPESSPPSYQVQ